MNLKTFLGGGTEARISCENSSFYLSASWITIFESECSLPLFFFNQFFSPIQKLREISHNVKK